MYELIKTLEPTFSPFLMMTKSSKSLKLGIREKLQYSFRKPLSNKVGENLRQLLKIREVHSKENHNSIPKKTIIVGDCHSQLYQNKLDKNHSQLKKMFK